MVTISITDLFCRGYYLYQCSERRGRPTVPAAGCCMPCSECYYYQLVGPATNGPRQFANACAVLYEPHSRAQAVCNLMLVYSHGQPC